MKIQNSEGHIVEVPRHLRKKIKQMLSNNQHEEVTQMFAQGGIIPISNPSGKQTVNRFKDGGNIESYVNKYMGDYSNNERDPGGYDNMRTMLETKHGLSPNQSVEVLNRLMNVMQKAPNQFSGTLDDNEYLKAPDIYEKPEAVLQRNLYSSDANKRINPKTLLPKKPFGYGEKTDMYGGGGKIPPYITNDPNDPRIQAYRDSSDKFTNSYNEFQKTRKEIKRDIGAFNYRADKYLSDSEKLAITGLQATHQRYSYKPQYEEKYYDNSELDKDIGNLSSRNKAKILGKSYLRDKSYTEAIGERVSDKSHFNSGRETNSPIGYYSIGDYRYENSRRITRKDFDNHLKGKVNKDVENYYNETDDNSKLDHRTINIDNILKRRDGFPKNYKDKYSEPFNSYIIPRYAAPKQQVIYNGPKPQIKETITANTVNKVKPVSRTKAKPKAKPIEQPVVTQQVTPEAQAQINTGSSTPVTLGMSSPDSSTGKRLYRYGNKDITEQEFNKYKTLGKHKIVEYGGGGEIYYSDPNKFIEAQQAYNDSTNYYNFMHSERRKIPHGADPKAWMNSKEANDLLIEESNLQGAIMDRNTRAGVKLGKLPYPTLPVSKPVYRPQHGLGGTIGSLLQAAAPIAGLIPGVGTLVGAAAGVVGNGLQQLDSGQKWDPTQTIGAGIQGATGMKVPGKMAQGGMTGLVPVNIEGYDVNSISMAKAKKGELLVNNGNVIKNYISRPPHPERGQNPLGDDEVQPGSIVIPKNRSQEYLNAGRALRKQIEASVVSQQVARESNMMRKGGQAGRSKMLPGGMAKDYFDREYPYAPSLNPHVGYAQVEQGGNHYMEGDAYRNARAGLPASYNNMSPMTPRDPFNSGYDQNIRTQMSNNNNNPGPRGSIYNRTDGGTPGEQDSGMSSFDKLNLGQFGLSMIPAIGDIIDATASVQTPQFGSLRNVSPNLLDPNTGQSQINQAYRSGYNSLRDSGVYSLKSNRNLVADRMQRSGDQALNIANQNAQIKNQFVGMNTDINKYNLDMQNQVELYRMQGQAKRREARRNLLDRAPAAASQYMQNGLYAKMLGI